MACGGVSPESWDCHFRELPGSKRHSAKAIAVRSRPAVHWASWADALKMIKQPHPGVADMIISSFARHKICFSIQFLLVCVDALEAAGFEVATWESKFRRGSRSSFCQGTCGLEFENERAMFLSYQGSMARIPFFSFPTDRVFRFDSQPFRILFLHRFQLFLPFSLCSCRCGRFFTHLATTVQLRGGVSVGVSCSLFVVRHETLTGNDSKWSLMVSRSTAAHSWPSTQRWSLFSTATVSPEEEHPAGKVSF